MSFQPYASPYPKMPSIVAPKAPVAPKKDRRYLNYMADRGGCGQWRIGWAEHFINMTGVGDSTSLTKMVLTKDWYRDLTAVKVQRQASGEQLKFVEALAGIKDEMGFKLMYEVDDVVFREDIPDYNMFKSSFDSDEVRQNCIDMINMVDEVTVTCQYMKDLYQEKTGKKEITVVPNFPPYWWIGHQYDYKKIINVFDSNKKKPRIVYAGSAAHFDIKGNDTKDDFSHVLKFITDNVDKYQFVFIGAVPKELRHFVFEKKIELHKWVDLMMYPTLLSKLDAQLFLAPLVDNSFNRSKSDIKFIEASCLGIPCLCQDMETYKNVPDELKFTDGDDLAAKVENILNWKNRSRYYKMVPNLREIGSRRFLELEQNIGCHLEALDTPFGSPDRKHLRVWNP